MNLKPLLILVTLSLFLSCQPEQPEDYDYCGKELKGFYPANYQVMHVKNYFDGLECAKYQNKPVLVYFTGYGCNSSSDEFGNHFIKSKKIRDLINTQFIMVQLFLDDPTEISKEDLEKLKQYYILENTEFQYHKIRNIGNMNAAIEMELIKSNSGPMYCIMTFDEVILTAPLGYTGGDKKMFIKKLEEGLEKFRN